jgi:hypothetical protein
MLRIGYDPKWRQVRYLALPRVNQLGDGRCLIDDGCGLAGVFLEHSALLIPKSFSALQ